MAHVQQPMQMHNMQVGMNRKNRSVWRTSAVECKGT